MVDGGDGGGGGGGAVGLGPSTQVSAHPSKQHKPLLGQSGEKKHQVRFITFKTKYLKLTPSSPVSLCPGLQQLEIAPEHSSEDFSPGAGHSPTSSPP